MRKRGAAHIEFIISILLFIGVVAFALVFFNPAGGERVISSSLVYSFTEVTQNTTVRLDSFSVKINSGEIIDIDVGDATGRSMVMNYDEDVVLPSIAIPGRVRFNPGNENFVIVRVSEGITVLGTPLSNPDPVTLPDAFEIASLTTRDIVSEDRMKELQTYYMRNYEDLKEDFNLPGIDFSFDLRFSATENVGATREIPEGLSVFSDIKRVEVLRDTGETVFAELVISVW